MAVTGKTTWTKQSIELAKAMEKEGWTLVEIARFFNRSPCALNTSIKRAEARFTRQKWERIG